MSESSPKDNAVDLSVDLAGLKLANPMMTASGTCGYGPEYKHYVALKRLGAFVTKAVSVEPRKGNSPPRTVETCGGMLNAIGLANVGLERFVVEKVPFLAELGIPAIVNVVGHSADEFVKVCARLDGIDAIAGLELNVSCPNVADGLDFGTERARLRSLVESVRSVVSESVLIVKLSPNVTDITETARGAIEGGADVLSMINTLHGMAINVDTRKPMLANRRGGLSGPAVKPIALCLVDTVYRAVARDAGVPIIAMGGISDWRDAVEFLLAGATGLAVGTALFVDPRTPLTVCDGIAEYLRGRGLGSVRELIGALE